MKVTRIYGDIPKIMGCADELGAAFGNVISSAVQCISACGGIHISTQFIASTKDGMGGSPHLGARQWGEHSWRRTIWNIRILFSTGDLSGDMALGLITSYWIVERYSGHMLVESATGVGSTFKIFLPVSPLPDHPA